MIRFLNFKDVSNLLKIMEKIKIDLFCTKIKIDLDTTKPNKILELMKIPLEASQN